MSEIATRIAENIADIRQTIADAAQRSGRTAEDVLLVAVTKYVGAPEVEAIVAAGCAEIGESRPQELWRKVEQLQDCPIHWHMIGHLQRNKARRVVPFITLLHSGDSLRLLENIARLSQEAGRTIDVLLEVNVSGDAAKHGFTPHEVEPLLPELAQLNGLRIRGLMAMGRWGGSLDEARVDFISLRDLRDNLAASCPPEISLDELSMGMSGDYEVAIEEGATMVRIGSALYEGIQR